MEYETRLRRMALEHFSISLMNNTRWRELVEAWEGIKTRGFRLKFIDEATVWDLRWLISPSSGYIEGGACGPMLFVAIEWLEILFANTPIGETDKGELRRRLQAHSIPFTEVSAGFRVTGYLRDSKK